MRLILYVVPAPGTNETPRYKIATNTSGTTGLGLSQAATSQAECAALPSGARLPANLGAPDAGYSEARPSDYSEVCSSLDAQSPGTSSLLHNRRPESVWVLCVRFA